MGSGDDDAQCVEVRITCWIKNCRDNWMVTIADLLYQISRLHIYRGNYRIDVIDNISAIF